MDERGMKIRLGIVALLTGLLCVIMVFVFADPASMLQRYEFDVKFPEAPGVSAGTPVEKFGIVIGRVTDVQIAEDGALVTVSIESKYPLRKNEDCRIGGRSLLGDSVITFAPSGDPTRPTDLIEEGDVISGQAATDPFQMVANLEGKLDGVILSITKTSDDIGMLSRQVREFLDTNDEQFNRVLAKSERTLDSIDSMANNFDRLLGDPQMQANFKATINRLPKLLDELETSAGGVSRAMALAERNLENLEGFTGPLGRRGDQMLQNADELFVKLARSADNLDRLMENLVLFSQSLSRSEGTIGRLMNDPQLYDNMNQATQNINRMMIELRPVIRDARTFADKIARHPELLGVRGAMQGSSGAKNVAPWGGF